MSICAIIPAYNEEKTIGEVVSVVKQSNIVNEVIVVSDGSTDATAIIARSLGAKVVEVQQNQGKGAAIHVGLDNTDSQIVVLLDADLVGLKPYHIAELAKPILAGDADMTLGLFDGGRVATDFAQVVAPHLTGQRAVRREVIEAVSRIDVTRFGVEIALTRHAKKNGIRVQEVTLRGLTHRTKEEKLGLSKGLAARVKMYWEIIKCAQRG